MALTRYGFSNCVGAFFEMPTTDARALLPAHLQPLERQHTRSILGLMAFQFTESEVGAYDELVLSILVPPLVEPGQPLPKAAFYPFMVGTSTRAAREHAIERWHLPHYMKDIQMAFTREDGRMDVAVTDEGRPVLDLVVTEYEFHPVSHLYNAFMIDADDRFKANIHMEGQHSEHEEERGSLTLHEHPMTEGLTLDDVSEYAFREQWFSRGVQTFEELERL